jgi:hypothetical protein
MHPLFGLTSSQDLHERLCCILHDGCYHIGTLPNTETIDELNDLFTTSSLRVLPLHKINLPSSVDAQPIQAVYQHQIIPNITRQPLFFLQVALVYNQLQDVNFTRESKLSWAALPALLWSFGILDLVRDVLMNEIIDETDGSYDIETNTQLKCYLFQAYDDYVSNRGTPVPPTRSRKTGMGFLTCKQLQ